MLVTLLICLLAALLAVGVGALLSAWPPAPGWLVRIVEFAVLLAAFVWLQTVLK